MGDIQYQERPIAGLHTGPSPGLHRLWRNETEVRFPTPLAP